MYIHVYTYTIMTTKITKWGNSYGIRIPKQFINELNLNEGSELELTIKGNTISIAPIKNKKLKIIKYNLKDLLKNYDPKTRHEEFDWGPDVGREILPPYNPDEI
jgi:antitoxin MazE